ncbi:dihydroorotase family protein [Utexia brackfieldae]|uniref:dihydroorotase n=1 Tax=Utexia brackfieldae TaxID=3074108 RepID=UPI00370DBFAE
MQWQHAIKNGLVYSDGHFISANIYVKAGKIAAITDANLGQAETETDASGLYVLPGLIDTHVHSRDPHATYKEDFYHSTLAAAMGGITAIFEMPNTNPSISSVAHLQQQIVNLESKANVDFALWGLCLGDLNNQSLSDLNDAGVVAFKFFWGYAIDKKSHLLAYQYKSGDPNLIAPLADGEVYDIFRAVKPTGKQLAIHAENSQLMSRFSQQIKQEGRCDYQALLDGRPDLVEAATISLAIQFAKSSGTPLHILHLTSKAGMDLIRQAQLDGVSITAETCPHYLFLTNEDFSRVGNEMKVYPPIKYQTDQDALWQGIADGTITSICSDHAPHTQEEKQGALFEVPAGMCGIETQVPLMLNAVNEGRLSLADVVGLMSENPAHIYHIYPKKGAIAVGSDADFTLVDMTKEKILSRDALHSKSKVMAYDGMKVKGLPVGTIVRGVTVVKDGELINDLQGKFFKPIK